ncbi:MAG: class 1 fructose-bisphosphatase [bacterium]
MSLAADFGVTLTQHVLTRQHLHPEARGQFSGLLTQIGVAGKLIAAQVRRAGLIEVWGKTGETNVQGETVKKLDRIANDTLKEVLRRSGCVAVMASEEEEGAVVVEPELSGEYVVAFDPLDGSSNIEASVSIGTIFAIYRRLPDVPPGPAHLLRPGRDQVAAGYIIYGSSTVLVYTDGNTVDCFTLDPGSGEFFLTRAAMAYRPATRILSLNECNEPYWPAWVAPYVGAIKARNDEDARRVTDRHIGSLVADFHRNLVKGGLFLYPVDARTGRGKLRLLYECNPLAFIAEVAGGAASYGGGRILDLQPTSLHERTGLIIGGVEDVALAERYVAEHGA